MKEKNNPLFFALEVRAPWPERLPAGRMVAEEGRHATLAYLGGVDRALVEAALPAMPLPGFRVGCAALFDSCLFLPPRRPTCATWRISWLEKGEEIASYQRELSSYLLKRALLPDRGGDRGFLPHTTLCRKPFSPSHWRESFSPLPLYFSSLHLYESRGALNYSPIWSHSMYPPFEEIDQTAGIAYQIYAEDIGQLFLHALLALAFNSPALLSHLEAQQQLADIDDVVIALNEAIARLDCSKGSPYKAVSFHGDLLRGEEGIYQWEMIVDV